MRARPPIYVETLVRADLARVWQLSQQPDLHARWDLRFQRIDYLPRDAGEPQRFRYATAGIDGIGISVGERRTADGSATSALRFSSNHPLSFIVHGSGYWKYVPGEDGVRFLTGYDYAPRWRRADRVLRPLMGWATAWSFDRLRLWAERGVVPRVSLVVALADVVMRLAFVVAAGLWHPGAGLGALLVVVLSPPSPLTPAARRCVRRPPDRSAATAPVTLDGLVAP